MKQETLSLPIKINSRNVLDRQHWAQKRRTKKEYALLIRNQMRLGRISLAKQEKFDLIIHSFRKKLLDFDNLVGGCKHLIDALIDERFIFDDSPKYLTLTVEQFVGGKEYSTAIYRRREGKDKRI